MLKLVQIRDIFFKDSVDPENIRSKLCLWPLLMQYFNF